MTKSYWTWGYKTTTPYFQWQARKGANNKNDREIEQNKQTAKKDK